jgi:hypothetical protein
MAGLRTWIMAVVTGAAVGVAGVGVLVAARVDDDYVRDPSRLQAPVVDRSADVAFHSADAFVSDDISASGRVRQRP